jgi:hypothetical protein
MNKTLLRCTVAITFVLLATIFIPHLDAVEALLLQDTYVDNGTTGGKPPPNASNYGSGMDLRVFKVNGRLGRTFLKFSFTTLPPGTTGSDVTHARLRFWVNGNSTVAGSISISPVTTAWDEYTLKDTTAGSLTFGAPKLSELPVMSVSNFISIDVTDWVKDWLNGSLVNEGIEIEASAATTLLNLAFDSKESNQTSHEPRLEIALSKIGPIGLMGPIGPRGPQGVAGPAGPAGPPGPLGPTGSIGATGPQGIAGADGTRWLSSTGTPAVNVGSLSDYYLDLNTGDVWQKVSNEAGPVWALQENIRGPRGPAGSEGPAGATGSNGSQGSAGIQGPPGPSGPGGSPGAPGSQGSAGPPGPAAVWPTHILPQGDLAMGEFTQGSSP